MVQVARPHFDAADCELLLAQFLKINIRCNVRDRHREIRVVHLASDRARKRAIDAGRSVNGHVTARKERWDKEWQALYVVAVRMSNEDMRAHRATLGQLDPQFAGTSSAVEDDQRSVGSLNLHAR